MSQRSAIAAPTNKTTADQAGACVKPEQCGEQPAFAQNLLHLQQAVGNRATQGLLSTGLFQTKLRIGPSGDRFEREADRMADTVMRMPEAVTAGNTSPVGQAQSGNVQRVCAGCEEELRRQPMEEEEELLQAKPSTNAPPSVNPGVASRIASLHGTGRPLSLPLRSFFEPRFNHDFSDVRVHTGGTAAASACVIKARAFTVGRDIAFGAGEYAPESDSGRQLLAHELTHTIQQTPLVARRKPLIQRQPETSSDADSAFDQTESQSPIEGPIEQPGQTPVGPEPEPDTPVPGETPAPGLIVGDETSELGLGQMGRSAFLAELRSGVCAAADEPLAGTQYTAQGCPTIELYLRIYEGFSAERIEQDLIRFMPEAAGITDAREYIPLMAARVRRSVAVWVQTGEITGVPEGLPTGLPGLGAIARILFKARNGGPRGSPNPQAIQSQLGAGRPLSNSVGSRMGSAFGRSLSDVRVHTDAKAAGLSNRFNARAFTVGNHIAFGAGEYRPGTLMGDALIAHELAHSVQQDGANASVAPMQPGNTGTTDLEKDADRSAASAVVALWGGVKSGLRNIAKNAVPRLRSGLRLQRCVASARQTRQPASANPASQRGTPPTARRQPASQRTDFTCDPVEDSYLNMQNELGEEGLLGFTRIDRSSTLLCATSPVIGTGQGPGTCTFPSVTPNLTVASKYAKPEEFNSGKTMELPSCGQVRVPIFIKTTEAVASLSRQAEQEHCDDLRIAFDRTLKPCAERANRLAGTPLVGNDENSCFRELVSQLGFNPINCSGEFVTLAKKTEERDAKDWHTMDPVLISRNCTKIIVGWKKAPTNKIGLPDVAPSKHIPASTQCAASTATGSTQTLGSPGGQGNEGEEP